MLKRLVIVLLTLAALLLMCGFSGCPCNATIGCCTLQ